MLILLINVSKQYRRRVFPPGDWIKGSVWIAYSNHPVSSTLCFGLYIVSLLFMLLPIDFSFSIPLISFYQGS